MVLFFAEHSQPPFIERSMRNARKVRKELREAEAARLLAPDAHDTITIVRGPQANGGPIGIVARHEKPQRA